MAAADAGCRRETRTSGTDALGSSCLSGPVRKLALFFAVLVFSPATGKAQSDSLLTRVLLDSAGISGPSNADLVVAPPRPQVRAIRFAASTGGFMFGMILGGFAGHEIQAEDCHRTCRRLTGDALLTGAAIGGAAGAALGAAFLDLRSVCTFDRRVIRTLAGAAVGGYAFFAASGGREERRGGSAFFIPIGAIGGSLGALGGCWKSRF